jgi:hypothetical protein
MKQTELLMKIFESIRVRNATNFWIRNRNGSFDDVFDNNSSIQEVLLFLKCVLRKTG